MSGFWPVRILTCQDFDPVGILTCQDFDPVGILDFGILSFGILACRDFEFQDFGRHPQKNVKHDLERFVNEPVNEPVFFIVKII